MQVNEDEINALQARLKAPVGQTSEVVEPPRFVPALLASLVPPRAIRATIADYWGGPPTVWAVNAVTDAALAYVEVEFDEALYTGETEREASSIVRARTAVPTTRSAWVRPLGRIAELTVIRTVVFADTGMHVAASVRFEGVETPVVLPDPRQIVDADQRTRVDVLVRAIREGMGVG
ncbi:hypothetical protein ACDT10_21865 [Mycobacterium intracellulare]|uniref:hypothetical protein n=1 Tax=Mycobacterium intracellulare TaxID=1767 RepID=UPI0035576B42